MAEDTQNAGTEPHLPGWAPIPDPTRLTSIAVDSAKDDLRREIASMREVLEARLDASDKAIVLLQTSQDRIPHHMAERVEQLQQIIMERFAVIQQKFLTDGERFLSIQQQFTERDARAELVSSSAKEAVATALQAAKEAVGAALQAAKEAVAAQNTASTNAILKSETSTDKRIDETIRLLNSTTSGLDGRISLIAESSKNTMTRQEVEQLWRAVMDKIDGPTGLAMRLENIVARGMGMRDEAGRMTQNNQWMIGAVMGALALLVALAALVMKMR